jgi:small subunit ribosomal protein S20
LTAAAAKLQAANRLLDRAVSKGVIHRNTAARRKSRLAKLLASKQTEQQTETK